MKAPLQITLRDMPHSDAIEAAIRKRAEKLEQISDNILRCHVVIEATHRHKHQGKHYQVRIDVTVPGDEIAIGRDPTERGDREDVYVAIRDAFDAAKRMLQNHGQRIRGEVKIHDVARHARVFRMFPAQECGFLRTPDNRDIYFHRNCLRDLDFGKLDVGTEVIYSEEQGNEGPQAAWVASGKHDTGT